MQRSILVTVVDKSGKPVKDASVTFWIYQTLASGGTDPTYTNASGEAFFNLDTDTFAEGEVTVNGSKSTGRASIKGSYRVEI